MFLAGIQLGGLGFEDHLHGDWARGDNDFWDVFALNTTGNSVKVDIVAGEDWCVDRAWQITTVATVRITGAVDQTEKTKGKSGNEEL